MAKRQDVGLKQERKFDCCSKCDPSKIRTGCNATCKDYKEEKAIRRKQMREYEKSLPPLITNYDFDKIGQPFGKRK